MAVDQESLTIHKTRVTLWLDYDAKHALGLVLRHSKRLDGILDWESVRDKGFSQLRPACQ